MNNTLKPTIGVMPKKIWLKQRFEELQKTVIARIESGEFLDSAHSWIEQMIEIQKQLNAMGEK